MSGVLINISLPVNQISEGFVRMLFSKFDFFRPTSMYGTLLTNGKTKKYELEKLLQGVKKELNRSGNSRIRIMDDNDNWMFITRHQYEAKLVCKIDYELFKQREVEILAWVEYSIQSQQGIVAYLCSSEDNLRQNMEDISKYERYFGASDSLLKIPSGRLAGELIIDIEQNPGHSHVFEDGMWFGSCWTMYFGKDYQNVIPKELFQTLQDVYLNEELGDGTIKIVLFENVMEYDTPNHRDTQWNFRRHTGMDEAARLYQQRDDEMIDTDPSLEIEEGEFPHGGIRLLTYYLDAKRNNVPRSLAIGRITKEVDKKGKVVWSQEEDLSE